MCLNYFRREFTLPYSRAIISYRGFKIGKKEFFNGMPSHRPIDDFPDVWLAPLHYLGIYSSHAVNPWRPDVAPQANIAPHELNNYGLYSYRTFRGLKRAEKPTYAARLKIWGKIVEHSNGYRSQFAEIVMLYVLSDVSFEDMMMKDALLLNAIYQVEVQPYVCRVVEPLQLT